jgi:F-type H+-transporting ATPase subunit b
VIKLDWTLLLQFANFVVLMLVLNVLLYRPLRAIIAKRRETVETSHARAKDLASQVDDKMARYQQQLQTAKQKGAQEKTQLKQQAVQEESGILKAAHAEGNGHIVVIKDQVATEAETARSLLKAETASLASLIATKVLGRAL